MIKHDTAWYLTYSDGRLCRVGNPRFSTCEEALEYANVPIALGRPLILWHGTEQRAIITPRAWSD